MLGESFCESLFSETMTPDQFQFLSSIGFMLLMDIIYDNKSKKIIIARLKELYENGNNRKK